MTRNIMRIVLLFTLVATLILSVVPIAQARTCSNATGAGKWGFTVTGTIITPNGPVSVVQVGRFTLDRAGNVVGSQARSLGGGIARETFKGTTTTNPDCTGSGTIQVFDESGSLVRTSGLDFVLVDNAREARYIVTSIVLPNGASIPPILAVDAKRLFPED